MNHYETIAIHVEGAVARVTLNRPDVRNAFNDRMLEELLEAFQRIHMAETVRVVVLTGAGSCFCAGADLNWLRRVKEFTYGQNLRESRVLADCLYAMYSCPKPTVARVNGPAIGGGTGLVAVCDIAIASSDAQFSFSEVKIGVVPACISPYVVRKMGEGKCRELFLTGERIGAERALQAGLLNQVTPPESLDQAVTSRVDQLLSSGPHALKMCKELLEKVPSMDLHTAGPYTAEMVARLRMSAEGQEGMDAFLQKRKPSWIVDAETGRQAETGKRGNGDTETR
ncbi:MAG: enoyl-CoA hydratase/isomerase family protein [Acidobacteriota bacterium]